MKILITLITIGQLCQASYKSGQCDQFCKMFDTGTFSGGVWLDKERKCRCFSDFDEAEMGILKMPYSIKKSTPDNSSTL